MKVGRRVWIYIHRRQSLFRKIMYSQILGCSKFSAVAIAGSSSLGYEPWYASLEHVQFVFALVLANKLTVRRGIWPIFLFEDWNMVSASGF